MCLVSWVRLANFNDALNKSIGQQFGFITPIGEAGTTRVGLRANVPGTVSSDLLPRLGLTAKHPFNQEDRIY